MNELNNKVVQTFPLGIKTILGTQIKVIVEYIKTDVAYIISMSVNNGFFTRKFSESNLYETGEGQFALVGDTYYGPKTSIYHEIEGKSLDKDINEVIYLLTKDIQNHLLKDKIDTMVEYLKNKGLNVAYTVDRNGQKLDFEVFNIDNPHRRVIFYFKKGEIKFDFKDDRMTQGQRLVELSEINEDLYTTVYKWFKGNSLS